MNHRTCCQARARKAGVVLGSLVILGVVTAAVGVARAGTGGELHSLPPANLPPELPQEVLECAPCHMNPGLQMSYRDSAGRFHQDYIDADAYVASIHFRNGKQKCTDCHEGDYSRFPHPADNPEPSCLDCHENLEQEYRAIDSMARRSVHFAPGGESELDCASCHSPHTMRPAREMTTAGKNAACVECHENRFNPTGLTLAQRHAWHPQAALHLDRIACIDCHTQPSGPGYSFRHDILPKEEATSDCYACHGADTKMAAYVGSFEGGRPRPYSRAALVRAYYLSGGTRSAGLDEAGIALMVLVILGTSAHALIRFRSARKEDG